MLIALVGVAVVAIGIERTWLAHVQPLWFDEAWTLSVATTPDWKSFVGEAYNDVNAPLYYALMRLWTMAAGASDFALRLPGLLAVIAAGLIPLASRIKGLSLEARLTWGVAIFGWWGVGLFLNGRCYGPLLALSVLQAIAFARLLERPSQRDAWLWCGLAAAAILTQYMAAIPAAAQGLVYLAARRKQAFRTWPALLAFAPMLGWMAFHAPRLRAFSGADVAWHPLVTPATALQFTAFTVNPSTPLGLALAALLIAATLLMAPRSPPQAKAEPDPATYLWLVVGAAVAGLVLMLIFGALRPSLTGRYLIPLAPGLLLGLVLCARRSAHPRLAYAALMALYLGVALWPRSFIAGLREGAPYGYEQASATLMRHGVTRVAFLWDHEATRIEAPASLQRAGGVFFRRAGDPVAVTPVVTRPDQDANPLALAAATGPHPGIIWIYNRRGATSARSFPPRIQALDPRWTCEQVGDGEIGNLACWRAP
ncbi:MAG: hypothetical protein JWR47_2695 [Phenylobacterium sp.]|nr:hypothetical protein [Phenylobacterium sp.]